MLYSEFLRGTEMPNSKETYSLYERVNALYMRDNSWDKEDAYNYACELARKENLMPQYPFTIHNITTGEILSGFAFQKDTLAVVIDKIDLLGFEPEEHYIDKLAVNDKCIIYNEYDKNTIYYLQRCDYSDSLYFITK